MAWPRRPRIHPADLRSPDGCGGRRRRIPRRCGSSRARTTCGGQQRGIGSRHGGLSWPARLIGPYRRRCFDLWRLRQGLALWESEASPPQDQRSMVDRRAVRHRIGVSRMERLFGWLQQLHELYRRWEVACILIPALPGEKQREFFHSADTRIAVQAQITEFLASFGEEIAVPQLVSETEAEFKEVADALLAARKLLIERLDAFPPSVEKSQAYLAATATGLDFWSWSDCADLLLALDVVPTDVVDEVLSELRVGIQKRRENRDMPDGLMYDDDIFWTVRFTVRPRGALPHWRAAHAAGPRITLGAGRGRMCAHAGRGRGSRTSRRVRGKSSSKRTVATGESMSVALAHLVSGQEDQGSWCWRSISSSPPSSRSIPLDRNGCQWPWRELDTSNRMQSPPRKARSDWSTKAGVGGLAGAVWQDGVPLAHGYLLRGAPVGDAEWRMVGRTAVDWLLRNQGDEGSWERPTERNPEPIVTTARALDAISRFERWPLPEPEGYLSAAQGLVRRALRLSREDNAASRRLAVAAAITGLRISSTRS